MKTKQIVSIIAVLCFCTAGIAQEPTQIQGIIKGEIELVPFATYSIKDAQDSSVVKYGVTNELGEFTVSVASGQTYYLAARASGYKEYNGASFLATGSDINLGELFMEVDAQMMESIEVVTFRPIVEVLPDMTVFNVANTINASGTNCFDLLRKAPGVVIDNNDNIMLEGKEGVQIYFDGKPSLLAGQEIVNILKSMQSSDVEKLEIITQPSAKFDAAGGAGIINIVMKRNKGIGSNGTAVLGASYGRNLKMNSSITLNNRTKKSQIYVNYTNNFGSSWNYMNLYRTQQGMVYDSQTETTRNTTTHSGKFGADWFLNDNHTLGVQGTINFRDSEADESTSTFIAPVNSESIDQVLRADNVNASNSINGSANLNYKYADTLGHEFVFNANYGIYNRETDNFQPNIYIDGSSDEEISQSLYRMVAPTDIDLFSIKADYSQNIRKGKFSTGIKYSKVSTINSFNFFENLGGEETLIAERSNDFIYDEYIGAGYVNYSGAIASKWKYQLGLRGEQTYSDGRLYSVLESADDRVTRKYFNLFPSGGLTYIAHPEHSLALNFSRRINRPNYQSLNPFVHQTDELSYRQGNPFLQPQYVSTAKLSHTFKHRFVTSLSYSFATNYFAMIRDTLDETKSFLITRNVANHRNIGLNVSLPVKITNWWNVYVNVNAYHASFIATDPKFMAASQAAVNVFASTKFILPAGFNLEVSGWYNSPFIMGGTYLIGSMGSLDLAVQKKFFKDRLSIRLSMNDILYTSPWKGDLEYSALQVNATGGWESRRVAVNVSYNFGSKEIKRFRKRETGAEEENERI